MTLSLVGLQALAAENTGEGFLGLVTVTLPDDPTPLRFVYNPVAVTSRGNVFSPALVDLRLASQVPGDPGRASFSISGIPQAELNKFFNASGEDPILVDIEYVLISDPETVEKSNLGLTLREFTVSAGDTVKGQLMGPAFFRQAYPGVPMNRRTVPGIFKTTP